jgi:hypothetical protein
MSWRSRLATDPHLGLVGDRGLAGRQSPRPRGYGKRVARSLLELIAFLCGATSQSRASGLPAQLGCRPFLPPGLPCAGRESGTLGTVRSPVVTVFPFWRHSSSGAARCLPRGSGVRLRLCWLRRFQAQPRSCPVHRVLRNLPGRREETFVDYRVRTGPGSEASVLGAQRILTPRGTHWADVKRSAMFKGQIGSRHR